MILKLYRGHDRLTIILIVLTGFLVWLQPLMHPVEHLLIYDTDPMPLYKLFIGLVRANLFAGTLVSFIMVMVTGFYLVNFNARLFFINERTFLPAIVFILLSGYFTALQTLSPVLIASFLIVVAVDRILGSYRKQGVAYNFFDASILIGTASLVYFNAIWFFIAVIAGIILLRAVNIREIVLSLVGLLVPYVFVTAAYYLSGADLHTLGDTLSHNLSGQSSAYYWSPLMTVISVINSLMLLIGMAHLWSVFNTKKVRSRKTFALLLWLMVIAVAAFLFVPSVSVEIFIIFMVPATYFLTHYMVFRGNKKMANVMFAIVFISVLILQLS
ncbi:MAG: hypothetical protein E4G95_08045 [Bacteroidia bacterium]|nr:MAG: hypothetical protein E4G95_08045 [Bacteroidia bacterium]